MTKIEAPSAYMICAEETEKHLLSWMLHSQKAIDIVAPYLREDHFYDPRWKEIAKIFIQLIQEGEPFNWQIVSARLKAQPYVIATMADVGELMSVPGSSTAPISSLLKTLDMYRKCRAMVSLSQILWMTGVKDPIADKQDQEIEIMLKQFDDIRLGIESPIITMEESVAENLKTIDDNQREETRHTGLLTGFRLIDQWGGLPIGMTILGAKSSHGKSSMAMAWALHAAKRGMKVAFFTFEMLSEELSARALSMETRDMKSQVSANTLMRMPLNADQKEATLTAVKRLRESGCLQNFMLNKDIACSYTKMELQIRQLVNHSGIKAVFVDYLQIVEMSRKGGQTKEEQIGNIAHRLHTLAVQLQIYIIVLSQMNRSIQGEPSMHQLRDSGQIAEAADSIAIVWRPEQDKLSSYNEPHQSWPTKGTALLKMEKFRNGPTGESLIRYMPHLTCYEDFKNPPSDAGANNQELFSTLSFL